MRTTACILLMLGEAARLSLSFSPHYRFTSQRRVVRQMSQWEDEDAEESNVKQALDYSDAGEELRKMEETLDDMGDYDANPDYAVENIGKIKNALEERTASLGIEKSQESIAAIKAIEERARAAAAGNRAGSELDLSQISSGAPPTQDGDEPSIFFEPEKMMTPEEIAEADPVGQLPIYEQFFYELGEAEFPSFLEATQEMFIVLASLVLSVGVIVGWDYAVQEGFKYIGIVKRPEVLESYRLKEGTVLPQGWTDNMSDEDIASFQEKYGGMPATAAPQSPSVDSLLESSPGLPDL